MEPRDDAMIRCRRSTSSQLPEKVPWTKSADEALRALLHCWVAVPDKYRTMALMRTVKEREVEEDRP